MDREHLFETIKQLLRKRGWTYKELSEALGLSESGIKKMFAARNCSLERLERIAALLEVPVAELMQLSQSPPIEEVMLSHAHQMWFLENMECFAFYWKLAIEGQSEAQIRAHYDVDAQTTRRWLSKLDDMGLIVLDPFDRVRLVHSPLVRWADDGPLLARLNRDWSKLLVEDAQCEGGPPRTFRLSYLALRPETARELEATLADLVDEYVRRARYESATSRAEGLKQARLLVCLAPGSFIDDTKLGFEGDTAPWKTTPG